VPSGKSLFIGNAGASLIEMPESLPLTDDCAPHFERMLLIRRTEEKLLELFSKGQINGTTHTSLGQECCSVGVISALDLARDVVFSNHRCHGHFLAYGGPLDRLLGELMGKRMGVCGGIGGSQHLQYRNFYSNGIQGGIVPAAAGMALAEKLKRSGAVTAVFLGDGTFGEGAVYEAFNIASLWGLPVLFVVEANGFAQSTPTHLELAGSLASRPRAFGIETEEIPVATVQQVHRAAAALAGTVRSQCRPCCLVLHTYRLGPHSKGDDLRTAGELAPAVERDPLNRLLRALPADRVEAAEQRVASQLAQALENCAGTAEMSYDEFLRVTGVGT
jgi:TPP-dependent pyruvate/acetoin dehydrogenase alpha subunit